MLKEYLRKKNHESIIIVVLSSFQYMKIIFFLRSAYNYRIGHADPIINSSSFLPSSSSRFLDGVMLIHQFPFFWKSKVVVSYMMWMSKKMMSPRKRQEWWWGNWKLQTIDVKNNEISSIFGLITMSMQNTLFNDRSVLFAYNFIISWLQMSVNIEHRAFLQFDELFRT